MENAICSISTGAGFLPSTVISYVPRDGRFPGIHMVGWGGGGVGWGMITFFALAHMVGATQHHGMGWGMITLLALAHMVAATQHHLSCTCTHGRCYATSWDGVGWGGG